MKFEHLINKDISLIIWNIDNENDVRVFLGAIIIEGDQWHFINREKGWKILLNEEQLERAHPVSDDLKKTLLGADYAISLSLGNLPHDKANLDLTGLTWNDVA